MSGPAPQTQPGAATSKLQCYISQCLTEDLRALYVGYCRMATRESLRKAAFIREELQDRGEVPGTSRRCSSPWVLLLFAFALLPLIVGCASTHTLLRIGAGVDITDKVHACDRKRDAWCGLKGPRDVALIELIYAPGLRTDSAFTPYCSWSHGSHWSAGPPFNSRFEQFIEVPACGAFVQLWGRP